MKQLVGGSNVGIHRLNSWRLISKVCFLLSCLEEACLRVCIRENSSLLLSTFDSTSSIDWFSETVIPLLLLMLMLLLFLHRRSPFLL
jgi:hypothetical protein